MSRPHWSIAIAAGASVVAAVAGCSSSAAHAGKTAPVVDSTSVSATPFGSSSASAPTRTAFVAQVERVCQQAVQAHGAHPFPVASFDPLHPDPSQLRTVGDYFARYGQLPAVAAALHRLSPGNGDAAAWSGVLKTADATAANAQRQIAAARAGDVSAFVTTVRQSATLTARLNADGVEFGFSKESACAQVFG